MKLAPLLLSLLTGARLVYGDAMANPIANPNASPTPVAVANNNSIPAQAAQRDILAIGAPGAPATAAAPPYHTGPASPGAMGGAMGGKSKNLVNSPIHS